MILFSTYLIYFDLFIHSILFSKASGMNTVYYSPSNKIFLTCLNFQALLKLAAPDMTSDEPITEEEEEIEIEDEYMEYFDIFHAITGALSVTWRKLG